jgi:hypothetical protein
MPRLPSWLAGLAVLWGATASPCMAHEGPPYPILVDERAGPYATSVWADPDVGTGTFYIILDATPGAVLPEIKSVKVRIRPVSGRLPETCHPASRQRIQNRVQYYVEVPFDSQEMWRVSIVVEGYRGGGEVVTEVEATPPGLGRWDLAIYLFPFVLIALIWMHGALRGRRGLSAVTPIARPSGA